MDQTDASSLREEGYRPSTRLRGDPSVSPFFEIKKLRVRELCSGWGAGQAPLRVSEYFRPTE